MGVPEASIGNGLVSDDVCPAVEIDHTLLKRMTILTFVMDCTKAGWVADAAGQKTALTSIGLSCNSKKHNCVVFMGLGTIDLRVQKNRIVGC